MKKFLALVLALVMTMSLVTISAGAEFTDDASITYEEAVDVMTAVGVVGGYADGTFNPTAGLTRGAAAKIICNMLLGPTTAEALVANDAPFSDVAADNVFAGYIAYCVNEGIISGYADGTFKPAAPLTGYAFMKMLLGALGYDAAVEGYVGSNWSINVAKRALNIGLDDGLVNEFAGAKALTREEAALYAFNTLKATMVEYKNKSTISVGDITVSSSAEASKVETESTASYNSVDDGLVQFCEQYFSKLLKTGSVDAYKSAANTWSYKGVKVGTYAGSATITYTKNLNTTAGKAQIEADLENYNNYGETVAMYANGETASVTVTAANIAALTGNGVEVEIYVSENGITKVVVIEYVVGKVTSVSDTNKTITIQAQVANTGAWGDDAASWTTEEGYGDFVKDDYVLVKAYNASSWTATGSTLTEVIALEEVEGLAAKKSTANNTINLAGVDYKAADAIAASNDVAGFTVSAKYDATLYLDPYGFVVFAKDGAAATNDALVAVLKAYSGLNEDGAVVPMIKGVTSNGETVVWETATLMTAAVNDLCTYTEDDGVYTLTQGVTSSSGVTTVADGDEYWVQGTTSLTGKEKSMNIGSVKAYFAPDMKTIFVNDGKAIVKDGIQKVTSASAIYVAIDKDDTTPYITAIYVRGVAANTTVSVNDLVLVLPTDIGDQDVINADGDLVTFDVYEAYVAGVEVDNFYTADSASLGFYTVEIDNDTKDYILDNNSYGTGDKGALSVTSELTYAALVDGILSTSSADFDISGATFVDTTAYGYGSMDEIKADLADSYSAIYGDTVKFVAVYDYDTNVASYVYVTSIA